MKRSLPSLSILLKGLRTIFFHPMLYAALLIHWGLINLPSPVDQAEVTEEEWLDQSIPIASSASLGVKSKAPPKSDPSQTEAQNNAKPKPNPLAEALVKSDPELAKLAEDKKRREEEAKRKAEAEKKKAEAEKKKAEAQASEEAKDKKQIDPDDETEQKQNDQAEVEGNDTNDQSLNKDSSQDEGEGAPEFNLELLPKPDLVFTTDSLSAYNPGFTPLVFQDIVEDARTLETTTSIDQAIAAITGIEEYQNFSFGDPIFEDTPEEAAGVGVVYEIQLADTTKYVSFIRRSSRWARKHKKNTLRSTTVFVLWNDNPVSSRV